MNTSDFKRISEEIKRSRYQNTKYYDTTIKKLKSIQEMYENFSTLITINGYLLSVLTKKGMCILGTELLDASVKTLGSIQYCVQNGAMSDSYALLRKHQDQSMMFLYFLEVVKKSKHNQNRQDKHIKNFFDWYQSKISKVNVGSIFNYLKTDKEVNKVLTEYKLETEWEKLRNHLHDHIHIKGRDNAFANYWQGYDYSSEQKTLSEFLDHITVTFFSTLIMIDSTLTMASDYVDHMEMGMNPPEGSQYIVAPFINEFIDEYIDKYDNDLVKYIRDNSVMNFK